MLATEPRYHTEQQRLTALAVRQVRRSRTTPEALQMLAVYQSTAALLAVEHGSNALAEQRIPVAGAKVVSTAFTLTPAAPSVLDDVDSGFQFDRIVASLVTDAGRSAMGVFAASRTREVGHIRTVTPPSCPRCAILAGRWYRWADDFKRHPGCDCTMMPGGREVATYDPYGAFQRGEIRGLTKAQTDAINAGADINQVVNATRGLQTINFAGRRAQVTLEGTTSRGLAFRALSSRGATTRNYLGPNGSMTRNVARAPRLSPEAIFRVADGDRALALRLLRANGYIL